MRFNAIHSAKDLSRRWFRAPAEFVSALNHTLQIATSDMVNWLVKDYGMEPWAAHLLIGYQGKYDVITVAGSVGLRIPRKLLPAR